MEIETLLKALEGGGNAATIALVYYLYSITARLRKVEDKMLYIITVLSLGGKIEHEFKERE